MKLGNQGIYKILCGVCNDAYIGQTNGRISARVEEHKLSLHNKQIISVLYKHHLDTGQIIDFDNCKQNQTPERQTKSKKWVV